MTSTGLIRVAILEDDERLRSQMGDVIGTARDMCLLWSHGTLAHAFAELNAAVTAPEAAPHVLLVDLGLPDGNGIGAIRLARTALSACEVMVISVFGDEDNVVAAIEAGASGYLLKDAVADSFLRTIRELHSGGSPISPSVARILLRRATGAGKSDAVVTENSSPEEYLAPREREILSLVAKGFNSYEIGRLLGISPNTVKTHIYRIYRKLAVHSRGEAVFEATKMGLLDPR